MAIAEPSAVFVIARITGSVLDNGDPLSRSADKSVGDAFDGWVYASRTH